MGRIHDIYEYSWLWHIVKKIKDAIWYPIVYRTTRRYHILDLRDGGNGYHVGWYDTDERMLQANFLLLKEFVEGEKPFEIHDWEWCEDSKAVAQDIKELYNWWIFGRKQKHDAIAREWHALEETKFLPVEGGGFKIQSDPRSAEILKKEEQLTAEDTEMLIKLMKIRRSLWT